MGSSDDLVAKLRGGSAANYDVISPSSDVAASIARTGLAEPLDMSKLPSYAQLSAKLRELPLVKSNGQTFGVPFMWGPNPLLYDTTAFPQAPDSWAVFWDAKYRGKISVWDDLSTLYMAAQLLGFANPDPSHLYNLSDQELSAVKQKLLALKPNVRKIWFAPTRFRHIGAAGRKPFPRKNSRTNLFRFYRTTPTELLRATPACPHSRPRRSLGRTRIFL